MAACLRCPGEVDLAALGSQDFGEGGVGSGERGVDGEGGCRGDAVGEAHGSTLAMVATGADASSPHAEFMRDAMNVV